MVFMNKSISKRCLILFINFCRILFLSVRWNAIIPNIAGINCFQDEQGRTTVDIDEVSRLKNVQRLESCPNHPIGLEKYAQFGIPVLFDRREQPKTCGGGGVH